MASRARSSSGGGGGGDAHLSGRRAACHAPIVHCCLDGAAIIKGAEQAVALGVRQRRLAAYELAAGHSNKDLQLFAKAATLGALVPERSPRHPAQRDALSLDGVRWVNLLVSGSGLCIFVDRGHCASCSRCTLAQQGPGAMPVRAAVNGFGRIGAILHL